jgi:hypothetical protein
MAKKKSTKISVTSKVDRRIYFYQMVDQFSGDEIPSASLLRFWSDLNKICATAGASSYLDFGNGDAVRPWIDYDAAFPLRARFGRTKKTDIPKIEGEGKFRDIPLNPGEGINHLFHMVMFQKGVVGVEFNFYAPRISTFALYIRKLLNEKVRFVPLLSATAASRLARLSSISLFSVKLKSDVLKTHQMGKSGLMDAIKSLESFSKPQTLQITLGVDGRGNENGLSIAAIKQAVRSLLSRGTASDDADCLESLIVRGREDEESKTDEIDLLSETIMSRQRILSTAPGSRSLDTNSAYRAIQAAYSDCRGEINDAVASS